MLTSPSGKSYIGQTIRPPQKRWKDHKDNAMCSIGKKKYKIGCPILAKAIIKYGFKTFKKVILIEVETQRFLDYYEIYYIKKYNTLTPNGYNIAPGGGGNSMTPKRLKIKIERLVSSTSLYKNFFNLFSNIKYYIQVLSSCLQKFFNF